MGKPLGRPASLITDVAPVALHQLLEGLTPRQLVWRVDEHTVNVEDCTLIWHEPSPVPKRGLWVEAVLPEDPCTGSTVVRASDDMVAVFNLMPDHWAANTRQPRHMQHPHASRQYG